MLVIISPIIPFNSQDIYSQITHVVNKKNFIGMETLVDEKMLIDKYRFTPNRDFDFNSENLLQIRKEVINTMNPYIEK